MNFSTKFKITSRNDKMSYVYDKYKEILVNSVLDIGADECLLRKELPSNVVYQGVGLGDSLHIKKVDLEKEKLNFNDNSFHTVICLDVLEHLENIHEVIDEIFRISSKYVLISLPNPYCDFISYMRSGKYMGKDKDMKFYGLTKEREQDRHKWFFSYTDAIEFVKYRANKNNYNIIDFYYNSISIFDNSFKSKVFEFFSKK